MKIAIAMLLATVAGALPAAVPAPATVAPLPRDSVYQSTAQLTDAQAHRFAWGEQRGRAQLVSMFYTSCRFVCPMIVDGAKSIEQSLTDEERARLGVTLISLDPKRDTPEVLARMQKERDLDAARWTLASARSSATCAPSPVSWESAIARSPTASSTTRPCWCCWTRTGA